MTQTSGDTETMADEQQQPEKKPLSEAQLQQRRDAAAKSTGPRTPEGKAASSRNAWKTGEHSAAAQLIKTEWAVGAFGKPCRSTCLRYPCALVDEGLTKPGGDCLDKTVYVQAFDAILDTIQGGGATESLQALLAAEAAGALELLRNAREEVAERGLYLPIYAIKKNGEVVMLDDKPVVAKYVDNPAYMKYVVLLDRLGLNLPELLATPRAIQKAETEGETGDVLQDLLQGVASMNLGTRRQPVTIDQEGD